MTLSRPLEERFWEKNPGAKLTDAKVREARKTYRPHHPEFGLNPLAEKYGVHPVVLGNAIKGRSWKHVQ